MNFSLGGTILACAGLLVLVTLSCSQPGSSPAQFRPLEFNVDTTLLGSAVSGGEITVRPPAHWSAADTMLVKLARNSLAADTTEFRFELTALYVDTSSGAMLLMKRFRALGGEPFSDWVRRFIAEFRAGRPQAGIREEWMMVSDVPIVQLQVSDSARVYFALICSANPPVGIDYAVPRPVWDREARAVESSIGSISK